MNRRNFISALLGAATLDPERLLWVPGQKLISIPKPFCVEVEHVAIFDLPRDIIQHRFCYTDGNHRIHVSAKSEGGAAVGRLVRDIETLLRTNFQRRGINGVDVRIGGIAWLPVRPEYD